MPKQVGSTKSQRRQLNRIRSAGAGHKPGSPAPGLNHTARQEFRRKLAESGQPAKPKPYTIFVKNGELYRRYTKSGRVYRHGY